MPIGAFLSKFAGPLITGGLSALGGLSQQSSSRSMAREQMRFQENLSNTAYQRAAADMQKAGLNRILAVGSPASTPGGAMGTAQNVLGAGVSSAMQYRRQRQDLKNLEASEAETRANTRAINATATQRQIQTAMTAAQLRLLNQVPTALSNMAMPWLQGLGEWQGPDPLGNLQNMVRDIPAVSSGRNLWNIWQNRNTFWREKWNALQNMFGSSARSKRDQLQEISAPRFRRRDLISRPRSRAGGRRNIRRGR